VVALVVVNALKHSPWGAFTLATTIPIAILMGLYMRFLRPGRVLEASAIGIALVMFAVVAGQWVAHSPSWAPVFTLTGPALALVVIVYGFAASALPVWLLLAPRDYLSAFIKVGVVLALAAGILLVRPTIHMPPLTRFVDGSGPGLRGALFPFCFITIACGAISGLPRADLLRHHAEALDARGRRAARRLRLDADGVVRRRDGDGRGLRARPGRLLRDQQPGGVVGATAQQAATTISSWGFPLDPATMEQLAKSVGEETLLNRTGGAPSLAVGMAHIFSGSIGGERLLGIWYHFAIMFEALFILTVLDAGTRVGRFMVQELAGRYLPWIARTHSWPSTIATSGVIVAAWGYFLYQGVLDPLGGINSLWPLFGIANQILASVALVVATTILLKMGRTRYVWVTLVPMAWLVTVTLSGSWQKLFHEDPRIGFLAQASGLEQRIAEGKVEEAKLADTRRVIFNNRLDAGVTGFFAVLILLLLAEAATEWYLILSGKRSATVRETPYVRTRWAEGSP
jgi:carbon starvation protein